MLYDKGWRALLFGVLVGTVNYFAGNTTYKLIYYVTNSIGFNDHSYTNLDNTLTETTNLS